MSDKNIQPIAFEMPKHQFNTIKVIGVGGGGSNAVNHMYQQEIHGVDFVICNTDAQALDNSPIPNKIQLGADLTEGMGAGANPEIGAKAAQESYNELRNVLSSNTKMVFITAGMGGGTGTGAAPIIAKIAKELSLLTVGIVTMPFEFEGKSRITQAQKGIEKLREHVDALIVINNNKLREVYGNLGYKSGFSKADEVLSTAARGIAEVITHHYKQNIDLNDAKTVLSNSGTAIMGSSLAHGKERAKNAITSALDSPLLNDNKITGAKNVLLLIVSGNQEVTLDEIGEINDYVRSEAGNDVNIILGLGDDEKLNEGISVTIIATGFSSNQQHHITNTEVKKIVHSLEDNQELNFDFSDEKTITPSRTPLLFDDEDDTDFSANQDDFTPEDKVVHTLEDDDDIPITQSFLKNIEVFFDEIMPENVRFHQEEKPTDDTDDFIIHLVEEKIIESKTHVQQMELAFDFSKNEATTIVHENKNSKVENNATIRHQLIDIEEHNDKSNPKNLSKNQKEIDKELDFEFKIGTDLTPENSVNKEPVSEAISPLSMSIAEFKKTSEMRKSSLRQYNHIFNTNLRNIEEIENEPAYKRMNVELNDEPSASNQHSRTSIQTDENGIQLRTNNSFLHDNVD